MQLAAEHGVELQLLGTVGGDYLYCDIDGSELIKLAIQQAQVIWKEAIQCYMK